MKLIGITGFARSGKDTAADMLVNEYAFKKYAFASPLKKACSEMFGLPLSDFHDDDIKEVVNEFWGLSPRQMAQLLGTEGGRELFRQDIWTKRADQEMLNFEKNNESLMYSGLVISDVRFENEADFIRSKNGLLIHVKRPGADGQVGENAHASEAGVKFKNSDSVIINDTSLYNLQLMVSKIMGNVFEVS